MTSIFFLHSAFREKSPRTSADIVLSFSIELAYRGRCPQEETGQRTFGLARIPRHGRGHECPPKSGRGLRRTSGGHTADNRRTSGFTKNHAPACRSSRCGIQRRQHGLQLLCPKLLKARQAVQAAQKLLTKVAMSRDPKTADSAQDLRSGNHEISYTIMKLDLPRILL